MIRPLRVAFAAALLSAASPGHAEPPAPPAPETGAAAPGSPATVPKPAEIPLPPPPAGTRPISRAAAPGPASSAARPAPAPAAAAPALSPEDAAVAAAAAAAAEEAAASPASAPPGPVPAAPGAKAAAPAPAALEGGARPSLAPASAPGARAGEPDVTLAPQKGGGVGMTVAQDLDSDKLRMAWAQTGGTLPAFEASFGAIFMYKDLSKTSGAGAYMNGVGFSGGVRLALLTLDPPDYETRDTSWTAWKLGIGGDMGVTSVTINLPTYRVNGVTYGGPQTASMSSTTLLMSLGFMHAVGSFSGPNDWTGFAMGLEWAPSSQRTVITDKAGHQTTASSFNPRGFAINFESGSLATMASTMGKKARLKMSIFMLPPTGDVPLLVTMSLGAVWY